MVANNCKTGDKFNHINCGVITVIEDGGQGYFENESGDWFSYIDDDLLEELI